MFDILMGVPEMQQFWDDLKIRKKNDSPGGEEQELFKKLGKAIRFLAADPRHPYMQTHEISPLSHRYGQKVFQSYLGKGTHAWRLYWVYGPNRRQITIIGLEPHPEDSKRGGYDRVSLSDLPQ